MWIAEKNCMCICKVEYSRHFFQLMKKTDTKKIWGVGK